MSYAIGGVNVNSREDWRQTYIPAVMSDRRTETFPGSGNRFATIGKKLPAGVKVEGWIEASSIANLKAAMDTEDARQDNTSPVTVAVNGASYTNQMLQSFEVISGLTEFVDGAGTQKVKYKVRYIWLGVSP